eukprot:g80567.t1
MSRAICDNTRISRIDVLQANAHSWHSRQRPGWIDTATCFLKAQRVPCIAGHIPRRHARRYRQPSPDGKHVPLVVRDESKDVPETGKVFVYAKGSAEAIQARCSPETVPADFDRVTERATASRVCMSSHCPEENCRKTR